MFKTIVTLKIKIISTENIHISEGYFSLFEWNCILKYFKVLTIQQISALKISMFFFKTYNNLIKLKKHTVDTCTYIFKKIQCKRRMEK